MDIVLGILLALAVFFLVVLIHELGHFIAARFAGAKVEEFGIGIPPVARTLFVDKKGTKFTLNWLPIGGFVRLKGESSHDEGVHDKDSFASRSFFGRACTILAGVVCNFLLAWGILSVLFWSGVSPVAINSKTAHSFDSKLFPSMEDAIHTGMLQIRGITMSPIEGSIAERSGVQKEDRIISINGNAAKKTEQVISEIRSTAGSVSLVVERAGKQETITLTPENGKIGAYVGYDVIGVNKEFRYTFSFLDAVVEGWKETIAQIRLTLDLFFSMIRSLVAPATPTERTEAVSQMGGPIAVGSLFVNLVTLQVAFGVIATIAAILSINLGVFNLLPIPALDGGRFVTMTIVEILTKMGISKSRIEGYEGLIHSAGFLLLLGVSVLVAIHDIYNIG